jgi:hypothetical protein
MISKLRRRIERSPRIAQAFAIPVAWYLRFCIATTKWTFEGVDGLSDDLANGPVLIACWHGRLLMIGPHWPQSHGNLSCLHDTAPIGRVAGALQAHFGLQPIEMSARLSNVAASRTVMKRARDGVSIGITADGPTGPCGKVKDAPLEWARTVQRPIYGYAFATKRHRILGTWDGMLLPLPFTHGAVVFQPLDVVVPRKASAQDIETARAGMQTGLETVTARADTIAK